MPATAVVAAILFAGVVLRSGTGPPETWREVASNQIVALTEGSAPD